MQEAAQAVAPVDMAAWRWLESCWLGRLEGESAARALAVVVADVEAEDVFEVAAAGDQEGGTGNYKDLKGSYTVRGSYSAKRTGEHSRSRALRPTETK